MEICFCHHFHQEFSKSVAHFMLIECRDHKGCAYLWWVFGKVGELVILRIVTWLSRRGQPRTQHSGLDRIKYIHLPSACSCIARCVKKCYCNAKRLNFLPLALASWIQDQERMPQAHLTWTQVPYFQQHHAPALLWTPSTLKMVWVDRDLNCMNFKNYRTKISRVVGYQALGKKKWRCWSICRCSSRTITWNDLPIRRRFAQEPQAASVTMLELVFPFVFLSLPSSSSSSFYCVHAQQAASPPSHVLSAPTCLEKWYSLHLPNLFIAPSTPKTLLLFSWQMCAHSPKGEA